MAVKPSQNPPSAYVETVEEIMRIYRSLPPRPTIDEVEAAKTVLETINNEEQSKLDEILKKQKPQDVPEELFNVSQEVKKYIVMLQSHEQRKEALHLADLDKLYDHLGELIQKASNLVLGDNNDNTHSQKQVDLGSIDSESERKSVFINDEGLINKSNKDDGDGVKLVASRSLNHSNSTRVSLLSSGSKDGEKYSLMKVAGIIEASARTGAGVLDLQGKLMDQIEWLPLSIGKLSGITELNISENRIMALPATIGSLKALKKFDAHSNQLINLPDSFGELVNLTDLDLRSNLLKSLPASFENLTNLLNLDLSSNSFTLLPEIVGNLTSLKTLNVETNKLQELPYTIGSCSALEELLLDFNQLRALPEALGKLEHLQVLKMHYNRIQRLPTTSGNLSNLRELDVSFNELEFVPESLCSATSLVRLNVSSNFADLTALPVSIGALQMLEELDISNNQIRYLPESFKMLSNLRIFRADETPLQFPPREIIKMGAQAVVQYMAGLIATRDVEAKPSEEKSFCFWFCSLFWPWGRNATQAGSA
ncbi:Plant intracellular ras-group-related lrr protein [Thalictrum thalictroides]|uniref:Plant intracellular ras-group-related lrr protein n=1 Tax=Thalictrum thalictroides TaxID=46969 RepID=A0A7J6WHM5_THATH|nr:Plant intracellular ras-group-related lrr protein [Thalictrum thalictroides]